MKSKLFTASLLASALFAGVGLAPAMAQGSYYPAAPQGSYPAPPQAMYPAPSQGTYTPGIDSAQQAISARIQQGMQSGRITPSEAQQLFRRDREIQAREAQYKSDGVATAQERQQLRSELDGLNAEVERMTNNREVVGQAGYPGNAATPGIDRAEYNVSQRIDEGVRAGLITRREARNLHNREGQIARHEASFKSDGVVTPQERRQLRNELTALRDQVERLMRNERRVRG